MGDHKPISKHKSYEEMAEYWDSYSLGEFWDQTEPVDFDVFNPLKNCYYVPIDGELLEGIRQIARTRGDRTKSLINTMIKKRMQEMKTK